MTATLQLARKAFPALGTLLMERQRGTFHVLLDGSDVAALESKQTIEVPLKPGHHTLQVRAGRYTSRERSFDAADEEIVNFRCTGARIWPLYLASIARPDLGIALRRE